MEKSMNMTINRLPAITWNRLKMNEAFVPDVKIPVAGTYEEQLGKHAGINLGSGLELHQADAGNKRGKIPVEICFAGHKPVSIIILRKIV